MCVPRRSAMAIWMLVWTHISGSLVGSADDVPIKNKIPYRPQNPLITLLWLVVEGSGNVWPQSGRVGVACHSNSSSWGFHYPFTCCPALNVCSTPSSSCPEPLEWLEETHLWLIHPLMSYHISLGSFKYHHSIYKLRDPFSIKCEHIYVRNVTPWSHSYPTW